MKNRLVQALSISLSAMVLAGPVGMTVYAQSAEETNDAVVTTEQQVYIDSEEVDLAEEDLNLVSEELNIVADDTEFAEEDSADFVDESIDEDNIEDEELGLCYVDDADLEECDIRDVEDTVDVLLDENTDEEVTAAIIANMEKCVEKAQTAYEEAQTAYKEAETKYNEAVKSNEEPIKECDSSIAELQQEIELAKKGLKNSDADDTAVDDPETGEEYNAAYGDAHAAKMIQDFYIPYSENLQVGQTIANFEPIVEESDKSHVKVRYDVKDANGVLLHTVYCDFGYELEGEEGALKLYTNKLIYDYSQPVVTPMVMRAAPKRAAKSSGIALLGVTSNTPAPAVIVPEIVYEFVYVDSPEWHELIAKYIEYLERQLDDVIVIKDSLTGDVDKLKERLMSAEKECSDAEARLQRAIDKLSTAKAAQEDNSSKEDKPVEDHSTDSNSSEADSSDENTGNSETVPPIEEASTGENQEEVPEEVADDTNSVANHSSEGSSKREYPAKSTVAEETEEAPEVLEEPEEEEDSAVVAFTGEDNHKGKGGNKGGSDQTNPLEDLMIPEDNDLPDPVEIVTVGEEETPLAITLAGILQHGKWFAGLAGVSAAGAGVSIFEVKRRAAAKIIDKLNQ